MISFEDNLEQLVRLDDSILADILNALWREDAIRSLDLGSISIHVKDGEVNLTGYLARDINLLMIENIARSVAGVITIHNHLIVDRDLIIQVAQALARNENTRPFNLPVDARHGWIHIGGEVPTHELQHLVEEVAGRVPYVRGVVALPEVSGEFSNLKQYTAQPRIGAVVYGRRREEGVVKQVVIQLDNRLVTHIVARFKELIDGSLIAHDFVIPIESLELVGDDSIFLARSAPSFEAFPVLDPDEYPLALFTWRAPYPYTAGEVRWSIRQIYKLPPGTPGTRMEPAGSELRLERTTMKPVIENV